MENSNPLKKPLDKLIDKDKLNKKKIIFFGANKSSKEMINYLKIKGYETEAIIDNDKRKEGMYLSGIRTYKPDSLLSTYEKDVIILIASDYHKQMCLQLKELGYGKRQVHVVHTMNGIYSSSYSTYMKHKLQFYRGYVRYQKVRKRYPEIPIYICPYPGTGDIYLISLYMERYNEQKGIEDYVTVIVGNGCGKLAHILGLKNIVVMNQEEADEMVVFCRVAGYKETNSKVLNDSYHQVLVRNIRGYKGITFNHMFKYGVFDLDRAEGIKLPDMKNCGDVSALNKKLSELGFNQGKTVIISPYANTIEHIPMEVWEKLVGKLIEMGYSVFTNSVGAEEPAIKGTSPVFLKYNEIFYGLEFAGAFIGLRSGLCDIISGVDCKKVVLYPEGKLFTFSSTYDYFSLEKMELCSDVTELVFNEVRYEELVGKIAEVFRQK